MRVLPSCRALRQSDVLEGRGPCESRNLFADWHALAGAHADEIQRPVFLRRVAMGAGRQALAAWIPSLGANLRTCARVEPRGSPGVECVLDQRRALPRADPAQPRELPAIELGCSAEVSATHRSCLRGSLRATMVALVYLLHAMLRAKDHERHSQRRFACRLRARGRPR